MARYGRIATRGLQFTHSYWDLSPLNVSRCLYYYVNMRYNDSLKLEGLWIESLYGYASRTRSDWA